ncbi:MAG: serine hydroxymethyltransferase [Oscillospiraceae bacterium]|nr:serine hydroxymethyltransferase [Oscillospiraceae bacterium]MBR2889688.1 serine hydroxymethyltransferase [Oscillospiraceae bacterium]
MYGKPLDSIGFVAEFDSEIAAMMNRELDRQRDGIELIASENFASPAVIAAMGSILTNKYAEGLPGKRYYGGCQYVDELEQLCIDRAKALFGAEFANVQPHSGAQANMAVQLALLQPGDTMMGMSLANGGHLSHGSPANMSGKYYNVVSYDVNHETGLIDYDQIRDMAKACQPKLIIAGASAYPRAIDFKAFADIAHEVGAVFMVDMAHIAGLVAGGAHMSPVPYADIVTTTTHKTLRGPRGGLILAREEYAKKLNSAVFPGTQGGPLEHVIAAKAICFKEAMDPSFSTYAHNVVANAKVMAEALLAEGFDLVTGGTDNHLMLADLRPMNISGKELQIRCDENHITLNKNAIPGDPAKPSITSGVRIGTAAATTRGLDADAFRQVAHCIALTARDFEGTQKEVRDTVAAICEKFPLYR